MKPLGCISSAWVLALILGLTGALCTTQVRGQKEPDAPTKAKVQAAYGKLPLSFEANQGQTDSQVKFLSRGKGYTLFLTPTEAVLALHKPHKNSLASVSDLPVSPQFYKNSLAPILGERVRVRGLEPEQTEQAVLHMKLIGANSHPQVVGLDALPGRSHYFILVLRLRKVGGA